MVKATAATDAGFVVPVANRDGYLVMVTLVVATATEAEAIDCVSAVLWGQQRAWVDSSALLDYAIDNMTPAPLTGGNAYVEGDAFVESTSAADADTPDEPCRKAGLQHHRQGDTAYSAALSPPESGNLR